MKNIITLCFFLFIAINSNAQCIFETNSGGFEYSVDIDLETTNVIYTQQGSTCNVNIKLDYDIDIDIVNAPAWWNENLYVLQGNYNCEGGSGPSFFDLPNGGGSGSVTSATFSFSNVNCDDVSLDCPITINVQGPSLNESGACGTFINATAPIELSSFSANAEEKFTSFSWATSSEINFSHFDLELSRDFRNWETAASIEGENLKEGAAYNFELYHEEEAFYARLTMIDLNGSYSQSDAIYLTKPIIEKEVNIYPNPSQGLINISNASDTYFAQVYDLNGKLAFQLDNVTDVLDLSSLQAGNYVLKLQNNSTEVVHKRISLFD
jgi:hypothetical protein